MAPPRQPAAWRLVNKSSDRLHRAPASTPTTSACRYRFIRSLLVTRRALLAAAEAAVAGRDSVTPEKKPSSRVAARKELALTQLSTPRAIARVRGKALHYDRAIPLVAVAAPSLAQPVHGRETCSGPVDVPVLDDETGMEFDWDRELPVSDRALQSLELRRIAMEKYGTAGQPGGAELRVMRGTLGSS